MTTQLMYLNCCSLVLGPDFTYCVAILPYISCFVFVLPGHTLALCASMTILILCLSCGMSSKKTGIQGGGGLACANAYALSYPVRLQKNLATGDEKGVVCITGLVCVNDYALGLIYSVFLKA